MIILTGLLYFALAVVVFKLLAFAVQFIFGIFLGICDEINVVMGGESIDIEEDNDL
ncbi:MAG: hypothetical protein J6A75_10750 [Lachnospiraceae bacterium]|nr:hypothetical protein [Lachnospiraceae bacterium]